MKSPWSVNKNHSKGNSANLWAKFVLRPGGNILSYPFIEFGIAPNIVTWVSLLTGLIGAFFVALSQPLLGILFLFLSQLLDYADGTVARALDKRSGWGRFLDSQFGGYINAAKWVAIAWLFLSYDQNTVLPVDLLIMFAFSVPIVGSLGQSVKLQKRNYENRVMNSSGFSTATGPVSGASARKRGKKQSESDKTKSPSYKKKIEKLILYVLGLWQGVNFPLFAVSLVGGYLEFYVIASVFFAVYALTYAWLKAFMTNAFLKGNPL